MDVHISYGVLFVLALVYAVVYLFQRYMKSKKNNEAEFLEELIGKYNYWKDMGEEEYAEAYKVLINRFTYVEDKEQ